MQLGRSVVAAHEKSPLSAFAGMKMLQDRVVASRVDRASLRPREGHDPGENTRDTADSWVVRRPGERVGERRFQLRAQGATRGEGTIDALDHGHRERPA